MIKPRAHILTAPAAVHGAFDYAELEALRLHPDGVLDFSVNSNPYGTPEAVLAALREVPLDRYPDRESLALRRALAAHHDLDPAALLIGNGTAELLLLLALAFVEVGDRALILTPTFSEYARVVGLMGASSHALPAQPDADFAHDAEAVSAALNAAPYQLVFCCNPNNPTGQMLPPAVIQGWATDHPETLFVIDEAYLQFADDAQTAWHEAAHNLLILRSMTKDYALAGLRLGYALGHPDLIAHLSRVRPAWNVNGLAQAAGLAALADADYLQRTLAGLRTAKRHLVADLQALGLAVLPSAVNYFLVRVGDATQFRRDLLAHGLMVRDCTSFGLPDYVRIATRTPDDNARLLAAIAQVRP